jgi:hypothetical protein
MRQTGKIALILLSLALCGAGALVHRQQTTAVVEVRPAELYAVVYNHFKAVRAADMALAYRQASTVVQQSQNIIEFSDRARAEFPGVLDAERMEFGSVDLREDRARIQVFFTDHRGQVTPCVYSLVRELEGWKIDGVRVKNRWPAGRRLGGIRA